MKLIGNYKDDVKDLVQGSEEYSIPSDIFITQTGSESQPSTPPTGFVPVQNPMVGTLSPQQQWSWSGANWNYVGETTVVYNSDYKIKLSVFETGVFQESYILEVDRDYYIKNN